MTLLLTAATPFEIAPLQSSLREQGQLQSDGSLLIGKVRVYIRITGVGLPLTAYHLTKALSARRYDLVINAGIAGAFNRALKLGDVVQVKSDRFADLGVEEADGSFTDVFDMELIEPNGMPFQNGVLVNPVSGFAFLPEVRALSINKVHGTDESVAAIQHLYPADIESMEGAAFFYVCLQEQLRFLQIRAISNYVEKRQREAWNIPLAIKNLNEVLIEMIKGLQ